MVAREARNNPLNGQGDVRVLMNKKTMMISHLTLRFPPLQTDRTLASLRLLAATWNAGNAAPPDAFDPWIPRDGADFDVMAISLQESTYRSKSRKPAASRTAGGSPASPAAASQEADSEDEEEEEARLAAENLRAAEERMIEKNAPPSGVDLEAVRQVAAIRHKRRQTAGEDGEEDEGDEAIQAQAISGSREVRGDEVVALGGGGRTRIGPTEIARRSPLFAAILEWIGRGWVVVECIMLGQIGLMVVIREEHMEHVSGVQWATEATGGPTRNLPNKGGCAIRLSLYETPLCFVGSHLAAHMQYAAVRDMDVAEIVDQVRMGQPEVDIDAQHYHCIWMGDLNYRLDRSIVDKATLPKEERWAEVSRLVEEERWDDLMEADQLRRSQREGRAFAEFVEEDYNFAPTFKVERREGTHYQHKRVPSYCDRVLWRSIPRAAAQLRCLRLYSAPELGTSDHKPVAASFRLQCVTPPTLAPRPTAAAPVLRFRVLEGANLMVSDLNGLSDPYVVFLSDPPGLIHPAGRGGCSPLCAGEMVPRTSIKGETLSPRWEGDEIPDLLLNVATPVQLTRCHIFLVLMDYDRTSRDDRMGQAVLSLEPLSGGNHFEFDLPVTMDTTQQGRLRGEVEVVWKPDKGFQRRPVPGTGSRCVLQ